MTLHWLFLHVLFLGIPLERRIWREKKGRLYFCNWTVASGGKDLVVCYGSGCVLKISLSLFLYVNLLFDRSIPFDSFYSIHSIKTTYRQLVQVWLNHVWNIYICFYEHRLNRPVRSAVLSLDSTSFQRDDSVLPLSHTRIEHAPREK